MDQIVIQANVCHHKDCGLAEEITINLTTDGRVESIVASCPNGHYARVVKSCPAFRAAVG